MSFTFICPPPAALTTQVNPTCPEKLGNITRFGIVQIAGGPFVDITDEAEWDLRLAAVDNTKVVFTPLLSDVEMPSSAAIESAKDDKTSPFGEGFLLGEGSVAVTAMVKNTEGTIKDTLKALQGFIGLGVVGFDSNGTEFAIGNVAIPISNWFVSTKSPGGISEVDSFSIAFTFKPCWDKGLTLNSLTWDANTKLNA